MKIIPIIGENYFGQWSKTRIACRAIVIKNGKLLLSYEAKTAQWMLPGGGMEKGESDAVCCKREVEEETGLLIYPSACMLEIDEYYEDCKWVNRYFFGQIVGTGKQCLTEREIAVGMEPRWLPWEETKAVFGEYSRYAKTDEMRRGMYLREYTALCELEKSALFSAE